MNPYAFAAQIGLKLGQSYLDNKARDKEQRALRRAQEQQRVAQQKEDNYANLVGAFGGRATPTQVPLSFSGSNKANTLRSLGQIAGIGSQAIGLYGDFKQAESARQAAQATQNLQRQAAEMAIDKSLAETAAQAAPIPKDPATFGAALQMLPQSDPRLLQTLGKTQTQIPEDLSKYGRSVFDATMNQRQLDAADQARERELFDLQKQLTSARINELTNPTQVGLTPYQQMQANAASRKKGFESAKGDVKAYITNNPLGTYESYLAEGGINSFDLDGGQIRDLKNVFIAEQEGIRKAFSEEQMTLLNGLAKDPAVKKIGAFRDSYLTLMSVLDDIEKNGNTGSGQIAAINAFQRMIDPATVREGDVELIRLGQSRAESYATEFKRLYESGNVVDKKLVLEFRQTANAMMGAYKRKADEILNVFQSSQTDFSRPLILNNVLKQGYDRMVGSSVDSLIKLQPNAKIPQTNDDDLRSSVSKALGLKYDGNYRQSINTGQAGAGGLFYRQN